MTGNKGAIKRRTRSQRSRVVQTAERLWAGLFGQEKLVPSSINAELVANLVSSDFGLQCDPEESGKLAIELLYAAITFDRIELSEIGHRSLMKANRALKLNYIDYSLQRFVISRNQMTFKTPVTTLPFTPRRLMVFMVAEGSFQGKDTTTPFKFINNNAGSLSVEVGSVKQRLEGMEFNGNNVAEAYHKTLIEGLGGLGSDFRFSLENWADNQTIWCFDVTPSQYNARAAHCTPQNVPTQLSVDIRFNTFPTDDNIILMVLSEFNQTCSVESSGMCSLAN